MTRLSVNINKVATIRNSRGANIPNLLQVARDCETFGAEGITVHPRPDERHIRYQDVLDLQPIVRTEFNIEGYPSDSFMQLVLGTKPTQVTLVPDAPDAITSNAGWNTINDETLLTNVVKTLKDAGIRVSIFVDANIDMIQGAAKIGADRVELYTEPYAHGYAKNKEKAIAPFILAAQRARELSLGVNAGHDLNLDNLNYLYLNIPWLQEVSIGHALISNALYMGLEKTIEAYKACLH